jgi:hypothetical protein
MSANTDPQTSRRSAAASQPQKRPGPITAAAPRRTTHGQTARPADDGRVTPSWPRTPAVGAPGKPRSRPQRARPPAGPGPPRPAPAPTGARPARPISTSTTETFGSASRPGQVPHGPGPGPSPGPGPPARAPGPGKMETIASFATPSEQTKHQIVRKFPALPRAAPKMQKFFFFFAFQMHQVSVSPKKEEKKKRSSCKNFKMGKRQTGEKIWSVTREERQDGEARNCGEAARASSPGASGGGFAPFPPENGPGAGGGRRGGRGRGGGRGSGEGGGRDSTEEREREEGAARPRRGRRGAEAAGDAGPPPPSRRQTRSSPPFLGQKVFRAEPEGL